MIGSDATFFGSRVGALDVWKINFLLFPAFPLSGSWIMPGSGWAGSRQEISGSKGVGWSADIGTVPEQESGKLEFVLQFSQTVVLPLHPCSRCGSRSLYPNGYMSAYGKGNTCMTKQFSLKLFHHYSKAIIYWSCTLF